MKKVVYLLSALFLFACASDDDNGQQILCNDTPLENVPWIKALVDNEALINRVGGIEITQYDYNGGSAFALVDCITSCIDSFTTIYDCEKNRICSLDGGVNFCEDFFNTATNPKVIFSSRGILNNNCKDNPVITDGVLFDKESDFTFTIESAEIVDNCIRLLVSGGSAFFSEEIKLVANGVKSRSNPAQLNLKLVFDPPVINSNKIIANSLSIAPNPKIFSHDISSLANPEETIILSIEGFSEFIEYTRIPQCGDPDVDCFALQEQEREMLDIQLEELKQLSESINCENSVDWNFTTVGSKACGGPQLYLAYNTKIDVDNFLSKTEIYTRAEDNFNKKWSIVSDCSLIQAPKEIECVEGKSKLIF